MLTEPWRALEICWGFSSADEPPHRALPLELGLIFTNDERPSIPIA